MELAEALQTIDLLRGHIEALEVQLAARDAAIQQLTNELILLRYECDRHERARFGDSRERVTTRELALPGVDLSVRNDNAAEPPPGERQLLWLFVRFRAVPYAASSRRSKRSSFARP